MPGKSPDPYVSLTEAAAHAGVSVKTVRRRIACGDLPAYRTGRLIRVRITDLDAMMRPLPTSGGGAA